LLFFFIYKPLQVNSLLLVSFQYKIILKKTFLIIRFPWNHGTAPLIEELYSGCKAPIEPDICGKELAKLFVTLPLVLQPIVIDFLLPLNWVFTPCTLLSWVKIPQQP
jgi:hypothetical protein